MSEGKQASFQQETQTIDTTTQVLYKKGRFVKHYAHGVGVITDITEQDVYGLTLRLIHVQVGNLKLQVPEGKAKDQLLPLSNAADWEKAFPLLALEPRPLASVWHRAATDLAARLELGTLASVCEVLRDTAPRGEDSISFSRREIFDTALTRLTEEYRVTFGVSKDEALLALQQHCPFEISKRFSERQSVVTRTRNVRRAKTGGEGYRDLYQPRKRPIREKVVKPPKPPREPKVKVAKPPRPPRVSKPKSLNKQQQIIVLTERLAALDAQLTAAQEMSVNERLVEATKAAELTALLAKAEETVRALTRERGILRSQVTRLKKGRKAPSTDQVSGKEIKRQIALVRAELFQYIFERTCAVERLEAYIKERVDWPKT